MITRRFLTLNLLISFIGLCMFSYTTHAKGVVNTKSPSMMTNPPLTEIEGHYLKFESVEAMEKASDIVAIVSPTDTFQQRKHVTTYYKENNQQFVKNFTTLTNVSVKYVLTAKKKANFQIKELTVAEHVGLFKDNDHLIKKIRFSGYYELQKNQLYLVFLGRNDNGTYYITNIENGKFLFRTPSVIEGFMEENNPIHQQFEVETFKRYQNKLAN